MTQQVHQQDAYLADTGGGGSYNYGQHPRPLFKGNISVAESVLIQPTVDC